MIKNTHYVLWSPRINQQPQSKELDNIRYQFPKVWIIVIRISEYHFGTHFWAQS